MSSSSQLILNDGYCSKGVSFGADRSVSGEVCFQTGMTGYIESLTDPSYSGQILVLSFPLIGNYGVPPESVDEFGIKKFFESDKIQVAGLIVGDYSENYSHWNAVKSLGDWLKEHDVPAVTGVDTRALIKHIRMKGSMIGKIVFESDNEEDIQFVDPNLTNLVDGVSRNDVVEYGEGDITVLMIDCGLKNNQLRSLLQLGVKVRVVPWDYNFFEDHDFHGLFISNGPGDPNMAMATVNHLKQFLERESNSKNPIPVMGICLGNQILGLAAGASTYKLLCGNRGHNQPCIDVFSKRCHLTMQNHGFAIDKESLSEDWMEWFYNANDNTNEGIIHKTHPFFSVQFHPEANGGPTETKYLFDYFLAKINAYKTNSPFHFDHPLAQEIIPAPVPEIHSVLILGSGGLTIGQAGEFDYSGSQAIKALKQEGIRTILINPNVATVQTSPKMADQVYFLPVTPEYVKKIILKEKPDGILVQFGGQTALNCGVDLYEEGFFEENSVVVLGTPIEAIIATEDRQIFSDRLREIDKYTAPSISALTLEEARAAAEKIGYPIILRAAYALGGLGSGFAENEKELDDLATLALSVSDQILIEKSMKGWKELEYEVVRDAYDNCITVCNMENFDPLGIHTGESIVVAPSQTLSDYNYHMLRQVSIEVVRHFGVVGECNIQFSLDPHSDKYYIIEVNARLSRSSALASKATGYPLAFVAAKLSLGYRLSDLRNTVTKVTTACFEPSLDYVVVKIPKWDLKKFDRVSPLIGTQMKSVGEVMAIGKTFEEALSKAIRMVTPHVNGFESGIVQATEDMLRNPSDERIFALADALHQGYSVDDIHEFTRIDRWFLNKLKNISDCETLLRSLDNISYDILFQAKKYGMSDLQIAKCTNRNELFIRKLRKEMGIIPVLKQIDTVSAEFPADNNYLFVTYHGTENDVAPLSEQVIVLGSGAYCIGSSVEFDWCAVNCIKTLEKLNYRTVMINYNPETVSTDYDECSRLYFEELSFERVMDIYEFETPVGLILSMGGQISNNLSEDLSRSNVNIMGTTPENINRAENRFKFSRMLDEMEIDQPKWKECKSIESTLEFCNEVGYPCIIRPSFVLSGAGMKVLYSDDEVKNYLDEVTLGSKYVVVVISKFISNSKEIDVDAVAKDGEVITFSICEHVELAGVHSGDATLVLPSQKIDAVTERKVIEATRKIGKQLNVSGPYNIQFIAKNDDIKVIECNLRASRSFPFVSKTLSINFAELATLAIMGEDLKPLPNKQKELKHVGVKVPQFSFSRLIGADPVLGVEMASTGEVACYGKNIYEAYLKGLKATGFNIPKKNIYISIGPFKDKQEFLPSIQDLSALGYKLYGSSGTADFYHNHGIDIEDIMQEDNIKEALVEKNIECCIILPSKNRQRRPSSYVTDGYKTRRSAISLGISLITNNKCAKLFAACLRYAVDDAPLARYDVITNVIRLPGLIDIHAHLRDPGQEHKEDWNSGTSAALAGGYTVVCAMPNTNPSITDKEALALVSERAAQSARCDYGIFVGAGTTNVDDAFEMADQACALKMYLNQTFSTLQLHDKTDWMLHLEKWPKDKPICCHAENNTMAAIILLAHLYDRTVHICHVSLREEILIIKKAKEQGLKVTCEVCPHHLLFSTDDLEVLGEGWSEVRPRLSTPEDNAALWENIDIIDVIATDHAPHTKEEKSGENPPPGFPGLETTLPLMLTAVNQGRLTIKQVIEKMYINPKRIFSVPDQDDTYIEVDMDYEWVIPEAMPFSKCRWTPFAGVHVKGIVRRVVLRGETAYLDGRVLSENGKGRNLFISSPSKIQVDEEQILNALPVIQQPHYKSRKTDSELKPLLGASIVSISQFSKDHLDHLFALSERMKGVVKRDGGLDLLKGKVSANMFYEPSTRTSSSFHAAMVRLGGSVIPFTPETTSVQKGESFIDTIKTMGSYCDVLILRHPSPGSAIEASQNSTKPVINAGDGTGEHPTQALLDAFTIRNELGTLNGLSIGIIGDLANGRTVHSLVKLLSLYRVKLTYISPPSLVLPEEILDELERKGVDQTIITTQEEFLNELPQFDVLYVTRIQKERFSSVEEYESVVDQFIITPEVMSYAKERMILMHPLPRVNEIAKEVDTDPRVAFFRQMENGLYVRMALLTQVLCPDWNKKF